jgi:hypothetical protein
MAYCLIRHWDSFIFFILPNKETLFIGMVIHRLGISNDSECDDGLNFSQCSKLETVSWYILVASAAQHSSLWLRRPGSSQPMPRTTKRREATDLPGTSRWFYTLLIARPVISR